MYKCVGPLARIFFPQLLPQVLDLEYQINTIPDIFLEASSSVRTPSWSDLALPVDYTAFDSHEFIIHSLPLSEAKFYVNPPSWCTALIRASNQ